MLRILISAFVVLPLFVTGAYAADPAPRFNCELPAEFYEDVTPAAPAPSEVPPSISTSQIASSATVTLAAGLLAPSAMYCQRTGDPSWLDGPPVISPDGLSIAHYKTGQYLRIARLKENLPIAYPLDYPGLGNFSFGDGVPKFAWASDASFLWAATRETWKPSNFAKSPLEAVTTNINEGVRTLPPLRHPAGPLDAILWIGHEGLALAQFGTRGGLYRPEHADPDPTLAIVDARQGTVLDTLAFKDVEVLKPRSPTAAHYAALRAVSAIKMPDGRVRVLVEVWHAQALHWIVWTQGEPPRVMPFPYPPSAPFPEIANRIVLTPDGTRVLVARMLGPKNGMCIRNGGCTQGDPVEGVSTALHDLESGQAVWSRSGRAAYVDRFPVPSISPDGRLALIPLLAADQATWRWRLGLISLDDGRLIQKLPLPWHDWAAGFTREGRAVWTHGLGTTVMYEMRDGAPNGAPARP